MKSILPKLRSLFGSDIIKTTLKNKVDEDRNKRSVGTWLIVDSLIFLILLLFISISMISFSMTLPDDTTYYNNFTETDEYFEDSMQAFLDSTVPKTEFVSLQNDRTEYTNLKVEQLIIKDLNIRQNGAELVNFDNLEQEIENELAISLNSIFADHDYIFVCSYSSEPEVDIFSNSNIVITNLDSPTQLSDDIELVFEKTYNPIDSEDDDPQNTDVVIQVYSV
jgi:hypothetical protein